MTPERWSQLSQVFHEALARPAGVREAFLAEACAGDASLRVEVESLIAAHEDADRFMESPAPADVALRGPLPRRLGPYELFEFIGAGGMGAVYRARDLRLGRNVAIKQLDLLALEGEAARKRFLNEARVISTLNHPNIVTVHDVGEIDGVLFFAMELLDGATLKTLLESGPMPSRQALPIAAQIADGLAAAHEAGVVHRDLKPENIMVGRDGLAKILDFGLAKRPDAISADDSSLTKPGTVLGTVGYMSPEQASGKPADFRSDQFAFGTILYEMVCGRRAFRGGTPLETMAAIVRDQPATLPADRSGSLLPLQWVLERCLAKDPEQRYGSTRDLAHDVVRLRDHVSLDTVGRPVRPARRCQQVVMAVGLLVAIGLSAGLLLRPVAVEPPMLRYLTYSGRDTAVAASPDGSTIAFASRRDGRQRIWLKQVGTGAEAALTSGPHDDHPRFSPDGSSVLFARTAGTMTSLYRVSLLGGEPRRMLDDAILGDWSPDGRRLAFVRFAREPGDVPRFLIGVASADGSAPRILERLETLVINPPRWSPDSRRIALSHGYGAAPLWSMLLVDAAGGSSRVLAPTPKTGRVSAPFWTRNGRELVYLQSDSVEDGTSGRVVRQNAATQETWTLYRGLSLGGSIDRLGDDRVVFTLQPARGNLQEQVVGSGAAVRAVTRGESDDRQPRYSADGRRIVFSSNRDGRLDLWEISTATGAMRRLTDTPSEDWDPALTASGKLLWSSKRTGNFEIWMAEADGTDARQVSRDCVDAENPSSTPDGEWIVYASHNPDHRGIWKVRADGSEASVLVSGNNGLPEVSPDGRLVLYEAFTPPTAAIRVARLADGTPVDFEIAIPNYRYRAETGFIRGRPRWTRDGRAVVFVELDEHGRSGVFVQDFRPGRDTRASRRALAGFDAERVTESYDVSPDGSRVALTLKDRSSHLVLADGLRGMDR